MVLDSSAVAAIFFNEPERAEFLKKLGNAERICISAATLVETRMVLRPELGQDGIDRLSRFLVTFAVRVIPFDERQAAIADEAFMKYGKGRHRARLNFDDCFTYALTKYLDEPLLFKGEDFSETDVELA